MPKTIIHLRKRDSTLYGLYHTPYSQKRGRKKKLKFIAKSRLKYADLKAVRAFVSFPSSVAVRALKINPVKCTRGRL